MFVYAIYNPKHGKIYIGQCMDIGLRLQEHNQGKYKNSYTSRFDGEWKLVYSQNVENRSNALKREKQLKSFRGREFVKTYIPR